MNKYLDLKKNFNSFRGQTFWSWYAASLDKKGNDSVNHRISRGEEGQPQ